MLGRIRRFFLEGGPLENLLKSGLTLLALLAVVVFANITCAAQDWLWFSREFEARPVSVIVYHGGERAELRPGDAGYEQLAEAVRDSLRSGAVRQSGIGLSPTSLDEAYHQYLTVEAFFDSPVKLHAPFKTPEFNQALFLITGRHADLPLVFLGTDGKYGHSAPALSTVEPIRDALRSLGDLG